LSSAQSNERQLPAACRSLRAALLEDLALGQRMIGNAQAQQAALVSNDYHMLSELEQQGRAIIAQQEANTIRREVAISGVMQACSPDSGEIDSTLSLTELAGRLPAVEAKSLLSVRASILEAERTLCDVNEGNRALVQNGLDLVNFTFHTIADLAARPAGYGPGAAPGKSPTFYLDHHA
jgi:hypothetical protein